MEELKDANDLLEEYVIVPYFMFNNLSAVSYYMPMDSVDNIL
jgi:hypothetical protein